MIPCHAATFETPKKVLLNGLWFGTPTPKRVYVWLHGLSSSMWSRHGIIEHLAKDETAILAFSNRGHDTVATIRKGTRRMTGGSGAEIFEDCVDDIDGAVRFAQERGASEIILVGHSTGCQKAIYWAHKRKSNGIAGVVLLAPLSDWASANAMKEAKPLLKGATQKARALLRAGKPHAFLPDGAWHHPITAQRFLSLFTPDSTEQSIFSYFDGARSPKIFTSVTAPVLALFAGKDEYGDRPAKRIAAWFEAHPPRRGVSCIIIPDVDHGFKGAEQNVAQSIAIWADKQ